MTDSVTDSVTALARRAALITIVVLTIAAFAGSLNNEFVNWDDRQTLVDNDAYKGLSPTHIKWMFTTGFAGHYQPLSWLSLAIDHQLWGGAVPAGYHLTNILLHTLAACGFFFLTLRLIRAGRRAPPSIGVVVGALTATLLFSIHPLRVESVAWATERRDVLSGALLMGCLLSYLRYVGATRRRRQWLCLSLLLFTLSLLAKASAMMLPVVLLLIDHYPLRRFDKSAKKRPTDSVKTVLLEKLAFAVPAAVVAMTAAWAQRSAGAMWSFDLHPLDLRIGQAFYGVVFYVWKTLCPMGLIPLYEQRPDATALDTVNVICAVAVTAVTVGLWTLRRRPAGLVAWLVYLALLLPVLGLAQSGPQIVADRYSYLSCMPWAIVAGGLMTSLWHYTGTRGLAWRGLALGVLAMCACVLTALTTAQTRIWVDSATLWRTVIDRAPNTGLAHANLAALMNHEGLYDSACDHAARALEILPRNRVAHIAAGRCAEAMGDLDKAVHHDDIALAIRTDDRGVMLHLAGVKARLGLDSEAEVLYRALLDMEPYSAFAYLNLGSFLASRQRTDDAIELFRKGVLLDPKVATTQYRLASLLMQRGELKSGLEVLLAGLEHVPDNPQLNAELAWVLATSANDDVRDGSAALAHAERAIAASGGALLKAWEAKAAALAEMGDFDAAQATLSAVLSNPGGGLSNAARTRLDTQLKGYRNNEPMRR